MTEIKRYQPAWSESIKSIVHGISDQGTFVLYKDHAAIVAALQEQARGLKERLQLVAELNDVASALHVEAEKKVRAQARAEGIHFAANRLLAAWESGFVDDTPAAAHDISGAILSAVEFLPNADEAEFKRDYADEVRARIRAGEQP